MKVNVLILDGCVLGMLSLRIPVSSIYLFISSLPFSNVFQSRQLLNCSVEWLFPSLEVLALLCGFAFCNSCFETRI